MGIEVLRAESPLGPFASWGEGPVTPSDWQCLDGTLYSRGVGAPGGAPDGAGTPFLVFSRSFRQAGEGQMCALEMSPDLRSARGEPRVLFNAAEAPWVKPFPFAEEFGVEGDVYLSDGPFLYRTDSGELLLLWSSFGTGGYTVGVARSRDGDIEGPWSHDREPLYAGDGGHCMVFRSREGKLLVALHSPNTKGAERPRFIELQETSAGLSLSVLAEVRKGE